MNLQHERMLTLCESLNLPFVAQAYPAAAHVNADLKLTHFCSERRFKSDTPPFHCHAAYLAGGASRLPFTIPAAR
jgi:hypothetical protein